MANVPTAIDPCPITEAIFELRFATSYPEDAIFGIIYERFKDDFPNVSQMPVLQIPAAVRAQENNLRFAPHYKLATENFIIQIGPKIFSLINLKEYCGWKTFFEKIQDVHTKIENLGLIEKRERTALRYINVFENMNIFDHTTLSVGLKGDPLGQHKMNLITEIPYPHGVNRLKIVNQAQVKFEQGIQQGSIIDIDTEVDLGQCLDFADGIEKAHEAEKSLFFRLLQPEFIQTMNPQY